MRKGLGPLVPAVQADLALTLGARGRPPKPSHISHTFVQKQNHPFGGNVIKLRKTGLHRNVVSSFL